MRVTLHDVEINFKTLPSQYTNVMNLQVGYNRHQYKIYFLSR
jgi:hypothetical protein